MRYVTVVLVMLVNVSFFNSKYPFPLNEGMDFISSIRSLAFIFVSSSVSFINVIFNGFVSSCRLECTFSAAIVTIYIVFAKWINIIM